MRAYIKRFQGYRLLAFDGSKIPLPQNKAIEEVFGSKPVGNQTGQSFNRHTRGTYQACYDVLNQIALQSVLGRSDAYEVDLAQEMLGELNSDDLLIFDRGYMAYPFMVELLKYNRPFLIRSPKSGSQVVLSMFEPGAPSSAIVELPIPQKYKQKVTSLGWPKTLKIRLIQVTLSTGEIEVLATSLLDEDGLSAQDFKALYHLRWGVETFFSKIKGRLNLENFTGKTVESVKQDFWSTVFISNLETVMTEGVDQKLNAARSEENKPIKINKAVSFNVIKKRALDIFSKETDKEKLFEQLERLFVLNPVIVREDREVPRKKISDTRSMNYQKRIRKHVF